MKTRYLTEEEHIKMVEEGTAFCVALAGITAASIRKFPDEIQEHVLMYLQDQTSLYQPFTAKLIERLVYDK